MDNDNLLKIRQYQEFQRRLTLSRYYNTVYRKVIFDSEDKIEHIVTLKSLTQTIQVKVADGDTVIIPDTMRAYEGFNDRIYKITGWNKPLEDIRESQIIDAITQEVEDISEIISQSASIGPLITIELKA